MNFLYFLEGLRTPFLDSFFSLFTHLGSETAFIVVSIIVFWCIDKNKGCYLMTVGFAGTLLSQMVKLLCMVPRPWVLDPEFTIVESAREGAAGYSFPSGHTQSVTALFGCAARSTEKTLLRVVSALLIAVTALSRMYLGVHTPADVLVGFIMSIVLVFMLYPLFERGRRNRGYVYAAAGGAVLLSLMYVVFSAIHPWPADMDAQNLYEGMKNGYIMLGCSAAVLISVWFDDRVLSFPTAAPWWAQVLKVVIGLVLALMIKEGAKPLLNALFEGHYAANAVRYFIMVIFAACIWPMTFRWFEHGCTFKKENKLRRYRGF